METFKVSLVELIVSGKLTEAKEIIFDILDEMAINVVKKYALVEISADEQKLVDISDASAKGSGN